jgi:predicted permease
VAFLITLLFNLAPAARAVRANLGSALREGGRSSVSGSSSFLRKTLGSIEIALALMLLIGAGLMVRSLLGLTRVELGFEPEHALSFELTPPPTKYTAEQVPAFYARLLERLRALPGATSAGGSSLLPLGGADASTGFFVEGKADNPGEPRQLHYRSVTPAYFPSLGIKVLRGRDVSDHDLATSPGTIVVNEALARRYWPGEDPIGKRLAIDFEVDAKKGDRAAAWRQVVGVVADVKHGGLEADALPEGFLPFPQYVARTMSLVVRAQGDPARLAGAVRGAVAAVDRDLPVSKIAPMKSLVSLSVSQPRFNMLLFVIFAVLAVILGAVGIYGVMSHLVAEHSREIGIRMSLGAKHRDVLQVVARQGLKLTLIGLAVGLGASVALGRVLTSLLYQVSATDSLTLAGASLLVVVAVALACVVPARRAMRVDPMKVLKYG